MIVKYLSYLFNLGSLYPELHLTLEKCEGGRQSQFGPGSIGCIGNCLMNIPPGEQNLESSSRAGMNSGLGGHRRSRRGAGREKHNHTQGQRH